MTSLIFVLASMLAVTCGVPLGQESRIIGGKVAPEGYAPHMVAFIFGSRAQFMVCGGSIISKSLVLTAAHCIEDMVVGSSLLETFHGRVGSNIWKSGGTVIRFSNHYIHSQWNSSLIKYDVGILALQKKLDLNDRQNLIAAISLSYEFVEGGVPCSVTGWGRTGPRFDENSVHLAPIPDELQLLYVTTLDQDQCQAHMTSVAGNRAPPIMRDIEICTFHSFRHGMCNGDSGSALVRVSTKEQIGIVSWGWNCATGAPDVFVRLYGVREFIQMIMDKYED